MLTSSRCNSRTGAYTNASISCASIFRIILFTLCLLANKLNQFTTHSQHGSLAVATTAVAISEEEAVQIRTVSNKLVSENSFVDLINYLHSIETRFGSLVIDDKLPSLYLLRGEHYQRHIFKTSSSNQT